MGDKINSLIHYSHQQLLLNQTAKNAFQHTSTPQQYTEIPGGCSSCGLKACSLKICVAQNCNGGEGAFWDGLRMEEVPLNQQKTNECQEQASTQHEGTKVGEQVYKTMLLHISILLHFNLCNYIWKGSILLSWKLLQSSAHLKSLPHVFWFILFNGNPHTWSQFAPSFGWSFYFPLLRKNPTNFPEFFFKKPISRGVNISFSLRVYLSESNNKLLIF